MASPKREIPLPQHLIDYGRQIGIVRLWQFLRDKGATPPGYTFWQLKRVIASGLCYEWEKEMLVKGGLWHS